MTVDGICNAVPLFHGCTRCHTLAPPRLDREGAQRSPSLQLAPPSRLGAAKQDVLGRRRQRRLSNLTPTLCRPASLAFALGFVLEGCHQEAVRPQSCSLQLGRVLGPLGHHLGHAVDHLHRKIWRVARRRSRLLRGGRKLGHCRAGNQAALVVHVLVRVAPPVHPTLVCLTVPLKQGAGDAGRRGCVSSCCFACRGLDTPPAALHSLGLLPARGPGRILPLSVGPAGRPARRREVGTGSRAQCGGSSPTTLRLACVHAPQQQARGVGHALAYPVHRSSQEAGAPALGPTLSVARHRLLGARRSVRDTRLSSHVGRALTRLV